jgi:hypothetical protein
MLADEFADTRIDLLPQIDVMRIERVVEIEHPGVDMVEGARCVRHFLLAVMPAHAGILSFSGSDEIRTRL